MSAVKCFLDSQSLMILSLESRDSFEVDDLVMDAKIIIQRMGT